jgi:GDP-4-dehydro-6-deoxy-D-mannose reductase
MTSMQRALITGISGFVGNHLASHLMEKGWKVAGYDLRPPRVECEFYPGDLSDQTAIKNAVQRFMPDMIFHLAGMLKSERHEELYSVHVLGTISLLDAIVTLGLTPKIVVASSSAVYGPGKSGRVLTEKSDLRPQTHYALSKAAQEMVAFRYHKVYGMPVVCVRTFNLLGPGLSPQMACSSFARQIALAETNGNPGVITTGKLSAKRDFVDVRDAVRAYGLIAKKGKPGEVYNVCSGHDVAVSECLDILLKQAKVPVEAIMVPAKMQKDDVPFQAGSAKKLTKATGWNPRILLKQSLTDMLNHWREHASME